MKSSRTDLSFYSRAMRGQALQCDVGATWVARDGLFAESAAKDQGRALVAVVVAGLTVVMFRTTSISTVQSFGAYSVCAIAVAGGVAKRARNSNTTSNAPDLGHCLTTALHILHYQVCAIMQISQNEAVSFLRSIGPVSGLCGAMGGVQASLCCCLERQKPPREFSPTPPPPPPHTHETAAIAAIAAGGEDDEEVECELGTYGTFLEYRETRARSKRSRSVPRNFRPCRQRVEAAETGKGEAKVEDLLVEVAETGNVDAKVQDQLRQLAGLPPLDSPFEPFLTREMVASDRVWRREVLGRLAWRKVPARPHCCANTCQECCQLWNESWRLAACAAARIPGQADPCRALEILALLPEECDEEDE